MLYKIAHILRDKLPWIWDIIGIINSFLFGLRYGSKMKNVQKILSHFTKTTDEAGNALSYRIESLGKDNLPMLAKMFAEQPASAFDFFKPHGFDELSLNKLAKIKVFLLISLLQKELFNKKYVLDISSSGVSFGGNPFVGI